MRRAPFLFALSSFGFRLVPDKDPAGGGENKPATLESRLESATAALTGAQSQVATLTGERDAAQSALTLSQAEVTRLQSQFDEATRLGTEARSEATRLQSELTAMTGLRDAAQGTLASAQTNISRLESLCALKGIDPASAVPHRPEPAAKKSLKEWETDMKSAKTPEARAKIAGALEAASKAGEIAPA